jgi:hypothetical protein
MRLLTLSWLLFGRTDELVSATPDAATLDQRQKHASRVDSAAEGEGGCVPYKGPGLMPFYVTELAIDVNAGDDGGIRIFSGETRTIAVGGREHRVWLAGARRIQTDDTVGYVDWAPGNGGLGLAVW